MARLSKSDAPVTGTAARTALAFVCLALWSTSLQAETLPIEGVYPAGNDQLAALNSLAIGPISREDGQSFGIALTQKLTEVRLRGAPYFTMVPFRTKAGADGTITGTATSNSTSRSEQGRRQECAYEDANGKCKKWRWVNINCTRRIVTLSYTLAVDGRRRERIFGRTNTASDSLLICPDSGEAPPVELVVEHLIAKVTTELRLEFAPLETRDDIRVKEGVEGLQNNAKKKFKEAIRLTKRNTASACTVWSEVDQLVPDHAPTLFNLGLCAESRRDYNGAEALYKRVFDLNRSERYATEAIERLERRRHAERQIAAHLSRARR
jgi:hypothetical protein